MGEKIVVGPVNKGLRTDREPFVIDNDSFPTLVNAYQWRGRILRKRGTSLLNRLRRYFNSNFTAWYNPDPYSNSIALVGGTGNILVDFGLEPGGSIVPGSVIIVDTTAGNTYTDPGLDGILVGAPSGSGTINYATGAITIVGGAANLITSAALYYPQLPVMGLEDLVLASTPFPGTLAFDTVYSYNILTTEPYKIYDVSFYKNPDVDPVNLPGYIPKGVNAVTPVKWNGQNFQQFWTVNYEDALWATNGIAIPFTNTNVGMQYKLITGVTIVAAGPPAIASITITGHGLVVGDFVFINEVTGITGINFQTGYVIVVTNANTVRVEFPNAKLGGVYAGGGIAQYLTNSSDKTLDCMRWYDGDPTNGNPDTPTLSGHKGWVNFTPPLSNLPYSIADLPAAQYYLVTARLIVPFKDRLLVFGPVVQTSSAGSQVYLQDTVIYSQNGTPYYTASFDGSKAGAVTSSQTVFNAVLVPQNQNTGGPSIQTATSNAWFEDVTGFGGFRQAGIQQAITTVVANQDVLLIGFTTLQSKLVYSGDDIVPFSFYQINSELGSGSTFSAINMDKGALTVGSRGFVITTQVGATRFDMDILDQIFQLNLLNNGEQRVCAQRDFVSEWIYFTYNTNEIEDAFLFPNQTLLYNYREQTWGIFNESYTTYGQFLRKTGYTWNTIGETFKKWNRWDQPWNAGTTTLKQPIVIAGNQQGFVIFRDDGTNEEESLYITDIAVSTVTSPNHNLTTGDFIIISDATGTVAPQVNDLVFSVQNVTENTFDLNPAIDGGTYNGLGVIRRMYVPQIQTKQFPVSWGAARKTRLGPQQYLFSNSATGDVGNGQIIVQIFLSQNASSAYNAGNILPSTNVSNDSLVYSSIMFTCSESTNLGLTPANVNLNMVTADQQNQIWHRINTSLLGDTVQIGFTMNEDQMRDPNLEIQFAEIELHGFILDVSPSMVLA